MARQRSDTERQADRRAISELYLKGWTQIEIAEQLGIDQSTVSRDCKVLKAEWAKQRNGLVDEFEGKYRFIYREAITAWEKSLEDAEVEIAEILKDTIGKDEKGGMTKTSKEKSSLRKEGQSGNPALLAQAQAALKAIREMVGVDAPTKQQQSGEVTLRIVRDGIQDTPAEETP